MRLLASIPALLAVSGAVSAAPVTPEPEQWPPAMTADQPGEAELKTIWEQGLNVAAQAVPIPASAILAPGAAVDDVFAAHSPARRADNNPLSKRVYDRGMCFEWASWVSANARQGYYNDFQYAKAIFQGYDQFGWNYIGREFSLSK